jgi:hypothetical protein
MAKFKTADRFTYGKIKRAALDALFDFSRDLGVVKGRPHIQVVGMVSDCYEHGFEKPVEDIMWLCALYIISGNWYEEPSKVIKQEIEDHLRKYGIDELLKDIPVDEASELRRDLEILNFIDLEKFSRPQC